jgi:hypothetical protein
MVYIIRSRLYLYLEAAGRTIPHSVSFRSCRSRNCRFGASTAEAWRDHGRIHPTLQGGEEQMLLNTDFRERSSRIGIIGIIEADQRSGFSIGIHLFGASGPEADDT